MKFIPGSFIACMLFFTQLSAQDSIRKTMLDSLNEAREADRGAFNLYIKKLQVEVIAGVFRNRETATQGFEPFTLTYHVYLPFQFELNYVHVKAEDKLLKINTTFIGHHSRYGNYAIGLGERFSFLTFKRTYLSYQVGIVWCERVKRNTNDGIDYMGFCLHHEFGLSYRISKHVALSANVLHLSNGGLFKDVKNNQDVLGLGVAYQF